MQVFLPLPSVINSLKCLDDLRLRKQLIEIHTICKINTDNNDGAWAHHPATLKVKKYPEFCLYYGFYNVKELQERGVDVSDDYINYFDNQPELKSDHYPTWFGLDTYHSSHRSKLLYKGRVDAVCYAIKKFLKLQSINKWLISIGFNEKPMLTPAETRSLENFAFDNNLQIPYNHYKQFNWGENDSGETGYFWPTKHGY